MATITIRLSDDTKDRWVAYCTEIGVKPRTAIRQSIERQVSTLDESQAENAAKLREPKSKQKKTRVPVWLTESEVDAIRVRQRIKGGTRAGWIIQAVRSALTRSPEFGDTEIEALNQSNYQLLSIGRNLNQIARRLNKHQKQQSVETAAIEKLRQQIDDHVKVVNRTMQASADRWLVE